MSVSYIQSAEFLKHSTKAAVATHAWVERHITATPTANNKKFIELVAELHGVDVAGLLGAMIDDYLSDPKKKAALLRGI